MLSKRWRLPFLVGALSAMVAVTAMACAEEEEAPPAETPAVETPAVAERIPGGSLTVHTIEPDRLDPHYSSFAQDISLQRMLWRGLYSLDRDNVPQPAMADGPPDISADGKTITVKLKDGLLWSDGDDLKAEDFVLGIHRTCNPVNAGQYQYLLSNIAGCDDYYLSLAGPDETPGTEDDLDPSAADLPALQNAVGVKAVDDTTIEFTLQNPGPTFPIILSLWMTFPVPAHLLPDPGQDWPSGPEAPGKLAYNGPYVLKEYKPGFSATLAPNPNWVGEIKPTLDTLTLRFIDDYAVADRAYEAGELDFALVNLTELTALRSQFEPTGEYLKLTRPSTRGLEMNLERPPLDKLDVRLALGRAVDHVAMLDRCFQGGHVYTTSWIPEESGGHPTDAFLDQLGYDPEAARQHLADAGFPNGEGFPKLSILVREGPQSECLAEFAQEAWRTNLNVNVDIEVVDGPTRAARFTAEDFDLFPGGWIQDYPDPENWVLGLYDTGGPLNHYNCSDPDIDALIEKARYNLNNEERLQQYKQINELIVTRVCGIFVGYHEAEHYLIKPHVVGMRENSTGQDAVIAGDWAAEAWGHSG